MLTTHARRPGLGDITNVWHLKKNEYGKTEGEEKASLDNWLWTRDVSIVSVNIQQANF